MSGIRIHALEGSMLSSKPGISKLMTIAREGDESTQVFVLSPVDSPELSMVSLLAAAAENDERLWSRFERSQNAWIETVDSTLCAEDAERVDNSISASFSQIEEILDAVWLLRDAPAAATKYLAELTSSFISMILDARFREEGIESVMMTPEEAVKCQGFPSGVVFVSGNLYSVPSSADASGKIRTEGESEYTAALIASAHKAPLTFWNSRSLLCSAARRDVPSAHVIRNLTYDEHTWGYHSYTGDEMYHRQFEWKRSNAFGAKALVEKVLNQSLKALAAQVKTESKAIFVYNPMNWERNDTVAIKNASAFPQCFEIIDGETSIPYVLEEEQLTFVAQRIPALGYKVFSIRETGRPAQFKTEFYFGSDFIENAFYKVAFYPDGTIRSIRDKQNGNREVVESAQKFNQYQYFDDFGIPFSNMGKKFSKHRWAMYTPQAQQAKLQIEQNAVYIAAVLNTGTFRAGGIRQQVRLYRDIPWIEIVNEVVKSPLPSLKSKEEAFYVFPFAAGKGYTIRYDLPIGNAAEGEQVYGTSTDWYTANQWVNVHDQSDDYSMTLAIPNTALLQFGERRTGRWSFDYHSEKPRIYSYIFNNMWQTNFQGDQPGYACFQYALSTGHGEDIGRINRFARAYSAPLQAVVIDGPQDADGPASGQYLTVSHSNLMLTTLKAAEANGGGMIVRFCEISGQAAAGVRVTLPRAIVSYNETDVIENDVEDSQSGNVITFDVPPYGLKTFRICTPQVLPAVSGGRAVSCGGKKNGTQVSWDGVRNALYYEVFRMRDGAPPQFLTATEKTEWFDTQVPAQLSGRYQYMVRACGSGEKGPFSDRIEIQSAAGKAPCSRALEKPILGVIPREKQRIDLYWTPVLGSVCYRIYRDGQQIGETENAYLCTYRDRSVSFGNTYRYTVTAVDAFGGGTQSETVAIAHNSELLAESDRKIARKGKGILKYF